MHDTMQSNTEFLRPLLHLITITTLIQKNQYVLFFKKKERKRKTASPSVAGHLPTPHYSPLTPFDVHSPSPTQTQQEQISRICV